MYPTLPTLLRIALVFGVGLDYFFKTESRTFAVVRREDRKRFPESPKARHVAYHFESLDFAATERRLSAFLADFEPKSVEDVRLHRHGGAEFIYVLEGKLGLHCQDRETALATGDAVYFDSSQPHGYRRVGRKKCRAVIVTVPGAST